MRKKSELKELVDKTLMSLTIQLLNNTIQEIICKGLEPIHIKNLIAISEQLTQSLKTE